MSNSRISKGLSSEKLKEDMVDLIKRYNNVDPNNQEIGRKYQMTLKCLKMFQDNNQDKCYSSIGEMVENFIYEMKFLYCSVHAYHDEKFDNFWFRPQITE